MSAPMKIDTVRMADMWSRGDLLRDIARAFGVSEAAISKRARDCELPKRKPGRWREAAQ